MPVGAVANSVWPITLAYARSGDRDFLRTRIGWNATHLMLAAIGVGMATLGAHLISLLTHDKFTEAYVLATLWIVYLIVQNTGKPQTAIFYAFGAGATYARIQAFAMLCGTGFLVFLVPAIGMYGAFCAALAQQLIMRIAVQRFARAIRPAPFQDQWAIAGAALILFTLWARHSFSTGILWDLGLLTLIMTLLILPGYRNFREMLPIILRRPSQ